MSHDFFDDLERQLVAATPERAGRLRRARARTAATLTTLLVALLAGGAGIAAAVGGDGDGGRAAAPAVTTTTTTTTTTPTPPLSAKTRDILARQTVAVLNGTTVPGLGRAVANRLTNADVRVGNVTNAPDQTRATTCVTYAPGHEDAGLRVAALLDLSPYVVSIATKAERVIAGDQATVIVTVGSDQNQAPVKRP
jgi:hypothetical protein